MPKTILRIDSSIKGAQSLSKQLSDDIIARLTAANPDASVTTRDLADMDLPMIDGGWIGAAFTPAEDRTPEQAATLALSDTLIAEVKAADVLMIGLPIYNFAAPAQLKTWIDHLCRAGETFRYSEAGPEGLVKGTRAIIAVASNGTQMGSEIDFASSYLQHMLGFIGITDVQFVAADRMAIDPEASMKAANDAIAGLTVAI
ncbi:FMN-dependent NADH-azoreductase [Actibacterium sp. D379-3]